MNKYIPLTKFLRTHMQVKTPLGVEFRKRDIKLPALPLNKKECPVCGDEMLVADGQLMRMHKSCKRELSKHNKNWKREYIK